MNKINKSFKKAIEDSWNEYRNEEVLESSDLIKKVAHRKEVYKK